MEYFEKVLLLAPERVTALRQVALEVPQLGIRLIVSTEDTNEAISVCGRAGGLACRSGGHLRALAGKPMKMVDCLSVRVRTAVENDADRLFDVAGQGQPGIILTDVGGHE
ncbi:hypothetical protein ACUN22_19015 [Streptomyces anulatus]|uniref:hypothetical protein n=1 Tax=Streptomyces anulatus TaxID=1892 RepID=UPI00403DB0FE